MRAVFRQQLRTGMTYSSPRGRAVVALLWLLLVFFASPIVAAPHYLDRVHTPMARLLDRAVRYETHYLTSQPYYRTYVRYGQLKENSDWREYIRSLPYVEAALVRSAPEAARKAFWINTYNAMAIDAVVQNYPLKGTAIVSDYPANSLRGNSKAWNMPLYVAGGNYSFEELRSILEAFGDPRVMLAISTGAYSSPALPREPYISDKLEYQLQDAVQNFCLDPVNVKMDRSSNVLFVSDLFRRHQDLLARVPRAAPPAYANSTPEVRAVLGFIWSYLPTDTRNYVSARKPPIKFLPFKWELNDLN